MNKTTLTDLLKRFDEEFLVFRDPDIVDGFKKEEIKSFLKQSIKDALEACRVAEKAHKCTHPESCSLEFYAEGFNQATTQYDENVKSFLGEKI